MGWFIVTRAIIVRLVFALHGLIAIWLLTAVTHNATHWYMASALSGLLLETLVTLYKKRGQEWKWFCPSVFFYLLSVVPAIWFLELQEMEWRIAEKEKQLKNVTIVNNILIGSNGTAVEVLVASVPGLKEIASWKSEQLVRLLEQLLLLILILGRWLLPKGALTHDQLSQLLLVYIGTAADIVEFFDAFKEETVRNDRVLCMLILSIWSWSLLQFTLVLTATKERKDRSGLLARQKSLHLIASPESCCTPDVYGIVISIMMQDAPFLVLRMLLIFKYGVLSYTNMFFTCKNTLVCMLLTYRLSVIQLERCNERYHLFGSARHRESSSVNSWTGLAMVHGASSGPNAVDQYYHYTTRVNLREPVFDPDEPPVKYVIHSRYVDLCPEYLCQSKPAKSGGAKQDSQSVAESMQSKWRSCDMTETPGSDDRTTGDCLSVKGGGLHCSDPELYSSRITVIDMPSYQTNSFNNNVCHISAV